MGAEGTSSRMATIQGQRIQNDLKGGNTDSSWVLNMLLQHHKLLTRNKSLEASVPLIGVARNLWVDSDPLDILGLWKECMHENLLSADLEVDVAVPELSHLVIHSRLLELLDSEDGLVNAHKLNKRLHSLGSNTLHHDMDWLLDLWNRASIAPEESENLLGGDGKWNLRKTISRL